MLYFVFYVPSATLSFQPWVEASTLWRVQLWRAACRKAKHNPAPIGLTHREGCSKFLLKNVIFEASIGEMQRFCGRRQGQLSAGGTGGFAACSWQKERGERWRVCVSMRWGGSGAGRARPTLQPTCHRTLQARRRATGNLAVQVFGAAWRWPGCSPDIWEGRSALAQVNAPKTTKRRCFLFRVRTEGEKN